MLWYSVGAFIMAFQQTPETIDFWRLIAGIGLGVELVNVDAYLSELVPKERRGAAFAFNQCVMYTAVPIVAFLCTWRLGADENLFGLDGWRWVIIIGSVRGRLHQSGRITSVCRKVFQRWLAQHLAARPQAERIVSEMEDRARAETRSRLCHRPKLSPARPSKRPARGPRCGTRPIGAAPSF